MNVKMSLFLQKEYFYKMTKCLLFLLVDVIQRFFFSLDAEIILIFFQEKLKTYGFSFISKK